MIYQENLERIAKENEFFRRVLYTGKKTQLVAMNLLPGEEIGEETHAATDQVFFFASGAGSAVIDQKPRPVREGDVLFVPAGTLHNIRNTGKSSMKLTTMYAPPEHPAGTVEETRNDALAASH